ncbi:unnamed protein product [Medioppia subpectinata]|uniref:NF-X1-type domain-containing protein n=1 Tax=Medioppia subpectinata TaxID=1979941 RepID=A0A7R9PW39_9ACAR|nr:unnamed protein product [Medioppia subpectinata]CAG2103363.1 unnamed protein product [Medioppia subpectinata]
MNSYKSVKLFEPKEWPKLSSIVFDDSQYEAYKTALMKRFVLIQGPPGTGKTYVGLKIVQTLYHNRMVWNNNPRNMKPIVIICYTNHALDQFLEGMLEFTTNIVRIGGRSKSEKLIDNTLSAVRLKRKDLCPRELNYKIAVTFGKLERMHFEITTLDKQINNCCVDLLNPEFFLRESGDKKWIKWQIKSLLTNYSNEFDLALIKWLTDCEYSDQNDRKAVVLKPLNRFDVLSQVDENGNTCHRIGGDSNVELDVGEVDVKRIQESRVVDREMDIELKTEAAAEDSPGVCNTIFLSNKKSLNGISRKVRNRLLSEMSVQLVSTDVMTNGEAFRISDVTQLSYVDRWRLYRLWVREYTTSRKRRLDAIQALYESELPFLKNLFLQKDLHLIGGIAIVGMTTTGASKFRPILEAIDPQIVVVEEAAEVMESHIVTSLTKNTEHLILIGDHRQLRPQSAVWELSKRYNLDVSLFERMILNGMPFHQLRLQHRMRPEICKLLVPYIYSRLDDHDIVRHYDDVTGVKRNLYFINHTNRESGSGERMSRLNEFEAKFIIRLAKHLMYQNYDKTQITILTPYSSQYLLINRLLRADSMFEGMRACIVDNYQGEENELILLSFVRSNDQNEIGFLRTVNRVNVALSRAKRGLYCVGNFDHFIKSSDLWSQLMIYVSKADAIGRSLQLCCPNHPNGDDICVETVADFDRKSPFGGCTQSYAHDLPCGHACPQHVCHVSHQFIRCQIHCKQPLKCGHICPNKCHFPDDCPPCVVLVPKVVPKCGHEVEELCSGDGFCYYPCDKTLECGHQCDNACGEDCQTACTVELMKTVEGCGHSLLFQCSRSAVCYRLCGKPLSCGHECSLSCPEPCDESKCMVTVRRRFESCGHEVVMLCSQKLESIECQEIMDVELDCGHVYAISCNKKKYFSKSIDNCSQKCDTQLVCGHRCEGTCVQCNQSRLHVKCDKVCEKMLICGHKCESVCGDNCPPCDQICHNSCRHQSCVHTCGQPCIRCPKACQWRCEHKSCRKRCYEPCDRDYCPLACQKRLQCGHKCIGLCGEICPDLCLTCDKWRANDYLYGIEELFELNKKNLCLNDQNLPKQNQLNELILLSQKSLPNNRIVRPMIAQLLQDLQSATQIDGVYGILSREQLFAIENKLLVIKYLMETMKELHVNGQHITDNFAAIEMPQLFRRMRKFLKFIGTDFVNTGQQIHDCGLEVRFFAVFGQLLLSLKDVVSDTDIKALTV